MNYCAVIVTFNRVEKLKREVESLLNQTIKPKSIIIIDNKSTDGTEEMILKKKESNPTIKYFKMNENLGGSGGFYEGVKIAMLEDVDWINISDDDVYYNENHFGYIDEQANIFKDVGCFSSTVKSLDGSIQTNHRRVVKNWNLMSQKELRNEDYLKNTDIDVFSFVGITIKKEIIKKVGLPEKDYFILFDDSEYSLRVRKITRILNLGENIVFHDSAANNSSSKSSWKFYYGKRNQIIMEMKFTENLNIYRIKLLKNYVKDFLDIIIKEKKISLIGTLNQSYYDGLKNKIGKNEKFLP